MFVAHVLNLILIAYFLVAFSLKNLLRKYTQKSVMLWADFLPTVFRNEYHLFLNSFFIVRFTFSWHLQKKYLISVYRKAVSGEHNDNHTMFMDPPKKCVILFFYIDIKVFFHTHTPTNTRYFVFISRCLTKQRITLTEAIYIDFFHTQGLFYSLRGKYPFMLLWSLIQNLLKLNEPWNSIRIFLSIFVKKYLFVIKIRIRFLPRVNSIYTCVYVYIYDRFRSYVRWYNKEIKIRKRKWKPGCFPWYIGVYFNEIYCICELYFLYIFVLFCTQKLIRHFRETLRSGV